MENPERVEGCLCLGWQEKGRKISTVIVDTDVLIWYFRGNRGARDFIADLPYKERMISALCVMELIQGCIDKSELKSVKEFIRLNFPRVIYPDEKIAEKAIVLLERYALSAGLRTVDALIAASAIFHKSALATANYRHFKGIEGLRVIRFEA
jgi:predicted nucleic acid-binding protein